MNADPTEWDYCADAIAMAVVDNLPREVIFDALLLSKTGQDLNAAIWAAIKLQDIVGAHRQ